MLLYNRLGIYTMMDLLNYYPRTYDTFRDPVSLSLLEEGEVMAVAGTISKRPDFHASSKLSVISVTLQEAGEKIKLTWYRMPFLRNKLRVGNYFIFRGKILRKGGIYCIEQPQIYTPAEYAQLKTVLQPIYSLTQGLTSKMIAKSVKSILTAYSGRIDYLPEAIKNKFNLMDYTDAINTIHFPENMEELIRARHRLVFDEFLLFIMMIHTMKEATVRVKSEFKITSNDITDRFLKNLPFELTDDQMKVWEDCKAGFESEYIMTRLIQGDVGSGKTILALLAMLLMAENGYQSAIMAPTEVLANQHFESISEILNANDIAYRPVLLTGSMTAKEKREAYALIESGEASIVIGTHALIQEKVVYKNLALAITDEQHRFGVRQRENLSLKGCMPHTIVMSATPIPRTLAIILYGDMDISAIRQMPKNRLPIKNCVVNTSYRKKAYNFMNKEIKNGSQVYIICPMVEANENLDAENVLDYAENLKMYFPQEVRIAYLHGKMKAPEKESVMSDFAAHKTDILVSTTVIEVGINVPNATVIMIENSERFGLAQLHQLRGRVGRGTKQSYCIFMTASKSDKHRERLDILNKSNDGFYIAQQDLKLRGPGDIFGIRQSGILDFKLADIFQDADILSEAQQGAAMAVNMIKEDDIEVRELKEQIGIYLRRDAPRL